MMILAVPFAKNLKKEMVLFRTNNGTKHWMQSLARVVALTDYGDVAQNHHDGTCVTMLVWPPRTHRLHTNSGQAGWPVDVLLGFSATLLAQAQRTT